MNITILIYDQFTALDAIGPYEVLCRIPGANIQFVGKERGLVPTDTNMLNISADYRMDDITETDILLIPGGLEGTYAAAKDGDILAWVQALHTKTQWTTSVCTGSLILGAAGILQGLEVTTHWGAREQLADYGATYVAQRFVQQDKIVTAAGVSAGIDMALWLVGKIMGTQIAESIQLGIEYDPQPPYDCGSYEKAPSALRDAMENALRPRLANDGGS